MGYGGLLFLLVVQLILVLLKLFGVIKWIWKVVLLPLKFATICAILATALLVATGCI